MASGGAWWAMPIPPGWEAKYDMNQKRYFFINHSTKLTTWEDPRQKVWQQEQQKQAAANSQWQQASGHRTEEAGSHKREDIPMSNMNATWKQELEDKYKMKVTVVDDDDEEDDDDDEDMEQAMKESMPVDETKLSRLKKQFPSAEELVIREQLFKAKNIESLTSVELKDLGYRKHTGVVNPPNNQVLANLKHEFPTADENVIKSVFAAVNNNYGRAHEELNWMGYRAEASPSSHSRPGSAERGKSPHHHRPSSGSRIASPTPPVTKQHVSHRRSASPKPKTPSPPHVSDADKARTKEQIKSEMRDVDDQLIEMALSSCNYDKAKSIILLKAMSTTSTPTRKPSQDSRAASSGPSSRKSSQDASGATTSAAHGRRSTSPAKNVSTPTSSISAGYTPTTSGQASTSSMLKENKVVSNRKSPARAAAKTTARASPRGVHTRQAGSAEHSHARKYAQVHSTGYKSSNLTQAKGPDRGLVKGPDVDNLIDDYIIPKGAGHHKSTNDQKLACGANRAFRSGPDRANRCGPDRSLVNGPMYSTHLLVTDL